MDHATVLAPRAAHRRTGRLSDPLVRSSFALMLDTALSALTGFVFWTIASHRVPAGDVGVVTTTVSLTVLCGTLGTLGMPNTLVRYLARTLQRSRAIVVSALLVTQVTTVGVTAALWLSPLRPWASTTGWPLLLTLALMQLAGFGMVVNAGLLAMRLTGWIVVKNATAGLVRIALVLLPLGITSDAVGLLGVQVVGSGVACGLGLTALRRRLDGPVTGPRRALAGMGHFTAANYLAMAVGILPLSVSAAIVLRVLGREEAAYFSICLMILSLLSIIASAVSQSLFAEAQRDEAIGPLTRRAARGIAVLLVPAVAVAVVATPWVLGVFGPGYAEEGTPLLRWLSVAALPAAVCYVTDAYVNGQGDGRGYLLLNVQNSGTVLLFVAWGATHNLSAVGLGWCIAQCISAAVALCYVAISRRRHTAPDGLAPPLPVDPLRVDS